jgi:hypothetical protein
MDQKYYFSVGAIFKNESHSIKEWIRHYLHHGAEHFYLINDNSSDNFMEIIQEYVDKNIVTLFNVNEAYYFGRQRNLYTRHFLPIIKETKWLLIVDLDEYVWSKCHVNLTCLLRNNEHLSQIQIRETIFGSNGHIKQPKHIVKSFTKRKSDLSDDGRIKYFINSSYEFTNLNVHNATYLNEEDKVALHGSSTFINMFREFITFNHYCCQSLDFWNNIKCTRGDADDYLVRSPEDFHSYDINEVEDLELYNQNKSLYDDSADEDNCIDDIK